MVIPRASVQVRVVVALSALMLLTGCFYPYDMGGGDHFYTYDNHERNRNGATDWPVTIVFVGDASANKDNIARILHPALPHTGSWKYMHLRDAPGSAMWGASRGKKTKDYWYPHCWSGFNIRFYADGNNTMHNGWFNYVPATTHYDSFEGSLCLNGDSYGWSEWVEEVIADMFRDAGYRVEEDAWDMGTANNTGQDGKKFHENNGRATVIYIP